MKDKFFFNFFLIIFYYFKYFIYINIKILLKILFTSLVVHKKFYAISNGFQYV